MIKPSVLQVLAESHDDWIRMATSFGLSQYDVEQIVQEMYIRIDNAVKDVDRIMYDEDKVNTFYVYTTLKHLHWQNFHKVGRAKKRLELRYYSELRDSEVEHDSIMFNKFIESGDTLYDDFEIDFIESLSEFEMYGRVKEVTNEWHWYDRKIFDLYFKEGMSMRKLAKNTTISLSSIFNTIDNCRDKIRSKLKKDWKNYNNY